MKKIILIAAVAIAAAACSRTYDVNPASDQAIGFGTWTENLTKARTQGSSEFANGDDFAVYGYKLNGENKNVVFKKETAAGKTTYNVVSTSDGSTWTYSPTRYWDQSATSYTFYAVSPASIGDTPEVLDMSATTGEVTSGDITFAGNNNDILVADKKEVANASYNTKVNLVFNHIASLVDFKVKKDDLLGNAVLNITGFQISNIDNKGKFQVSSAYTDSHPVVTWTGTAYGTYTNASGVVSASLPTAVGSGTGNAQYLINNLVVMPQEFRSAENIQTVTISYTITDEAGNVNTFSNNSFNLYQQFDNTNDRKESAPFIAGWEAGKHYTFYITIGANAIVFSAEITDWTNVDAGYHYLVK